MHTGPSVAHSGMCKGQILQATGLGLDGVQPNNPEGNQLRTVRLGYRLFAKNIAGYIQCQRTDITRRRPGPRSERSYHLSFDLALELCSVYLGQ